MIDQMGFHDGFLDGVLVSDSTARIFVRSEGGKKFTLALNGVEALRANDLKQGNIILELRFMRPDELDADFVFEIYEYSDENKKTFVLNDWAEKAKEKGLTAIEITPSYGCCLWALFCTHAIIQGHVSS